MLCNTATLSSVSKPDPDHQQSSRTYFQTAFVLLLQTLIPPPKGWVRNWHWQQQTRPSKDTLRNLLGKAFQRKIEKLEMRTIAQHTVHIVFFLSFQLLVLILRSTRQFFSCNPCLNYMERKRGTKLVSSRSHNRTRTKPSHKECLPSRKIFKDCSNLKRMGAGTMKSKD